MNDDLISRKEAIAAIEQMQLEFISKNDVVSESIFTGMGRAREAIIQLPTAGKEAIKHEDKDKIIAELKADLDSLLNELKSVRETRDYLIDNRYKDGVISGLKFAIRCNGVSGGEVEK